ncbi:MAG: poly-gamma-glutamate synthase PgsB [Calditrichaeota bacterium]|nr:poly-gamma-glutamate synthase PgsB [Calditrichota bacterium]
MQIFALLVFLLLLLVLEKKIVSQSVKKIPIRIHVNGSRGKSSVTRYIAAGLRASGKKTFAKITGVQPVVFTPAADKEQIRRLGPARVNEQFRIIRRAAAQNADALVLECMSINPRLQQLESRIFAAQYYVITNILQDHQEELGSDRSSLEQAYYSAIPKNCTVFVATGQTNGQLSGYLQKKKSAVEITETLPEQQLNDLPEGVFKQNIELAVAVCKKIGIPATLSLPAILKEAEQTGNRVIVISERQNIGFVNGFAVNDTESASVFFEAVKEQHPLIKEYLIILNTRADRPMRSRMFADWLAKTAGAKKVILTGNHKSYTKRRLIKAGMPSRDVLLWKRKEVRQPRLVLSSLCKKNTLVVGFGNIKGDGLRIMKALNYDVV